MRLRIRDFRYHAIDRHLMLQLEIGWILIWMDMCARQAGRARA